MLVSRALPSAAGRPPANHDFWLMLRRTFVERFLTRTEVLDVCPECGDAPESDAPGCPDHPDAELIPVRRPVIADLLRHLESTAVRRPGTVANDNRHVVSAPQYQAVQRPASNPEEIVDIWQEAWQAWDRERAQAAAEPVVEAVVAQGSERTPAPWCQLSLPAPAPAPAIDRPWCQLFLPAPGFMPRSATELQRTLFFFGRRRMGHSVTADMDPSTPAR